MRLARRAVHHGAPGPRRGRARGASADRARATGEGRAAGGRDGGPRRPARRAGAAPRAACAARSTGACGCCAWSSDRLPGHRRQGRRPRLVDSHLAAIARDQQVRTVVLPAHRGAILDRNGSSWPSASAAKTVFATPYMLERPARRPPSELARRSKLKWRRVVPRASTNHKSGFAYVARQADPTLATGATALGLPGVGQLRRGVAHLPDERRGGPGRGLRRHRRPRPGRHGVSSTTSSSPARPGARWSCATRPGRRCASCSRCSRPRARTCA